MAAWIEDEAAITAQIPLQQDHPGPAQPIQEGPSMMHGHPDVWGKQVADTHRLFNENMQLQFAALGQGRLHWYQIDTPQVPSQIQISQVEILLKLQFPHKFGNARLMFVNHKAEILKPDARSGMLQNMLHPGEDGVLPGLSRQNIRILRALLNSLNYQGCKGLIPHGSARTDLDDCLPKNP